MNLKTERDIIAFATALTLSAFLACGCNQVTPTQTTAAPPTTSAPAPTAPTTSAQAAEAPPVSHTPIKDGVEKLLAQEAASPNSVFPKNTRLLSVDLKESTVTLDFSPEFNHLADMGESTESEAQHLLQKTLAAYPNVEKMRVTVNGRPFESQATDWGTPFAVRSADAGQTAGKSARKVSDSGEQP